MPDISKLGLPDDVAPDWTEGLPVCQTRCPSYDGKRCMVIGCRPISICEPTVRAMARAIPGFLEAK